MNYSPVMVFLGQIQIWGSAWTKVQFFLFPNQYKSQKLFLGKETWWSWIQSPTIYWIQLYSLQASKKIEKMSFNEYTIFVWYIILINTERQSSELLSESQILLTICLRSIGCLLIILSLGTDLCRIPLSSDFSDPYVATLKQVAFKIGPKNNT